jgi:hypothetical protein
MKELSTIMHKDSVEFARKYGLVILLLWQFLGGGIKESIRGVVREEITTLQTTITKLETRLAALESKKL